MPLILTPDQEQRLRERRDRGELTPAQLEAFSIYEQSRPQVPKLEPPPEPLPPRPAPEPIEPPGERVQLGIDPGSGVAIESPPLATPGERTDYERTFGKGLRRATAEGISLAPSLLTGVGAVPAALRTATGAVPWVLRNVLHPAYHALRSGALQYGADTAAQWLSPEGGFDPARSAGYTAAGEFGVGRVLPTVQGSWRLLKRPWEETPMGTVHREVIEGLGGEAPVSVTSERYMPRMVSQGLKHSPMGFFLRNYEERALKRVNDELVRMQEANPGGRVSAAQGVLGRGLEHLGNPALLERLPGELRDQLRKVGPIAERLATDGYRALDANYLSRSMPWTTSKRMVPAITKVEDLLLDPALASQLEPESLVEKSTRLFQGLRGLPNTITVDTAVDMQRTVESFQNEARAMLEEVRKGTRRADGITDSVSQVLMPRLDEAMQALNTELAPFLVDIRGAKEHASRVITDWKRSLQIPEALLVGQQPTGSMTTTLDPDVIGAINFLNKPDFVTFTDAHQLRSQWKKVGRLESPVIGDSVAKRAEDVAFQVNQAMSDRAKLLNPPLYNQWTVTNGIYAEMADQWNSPYVSGLMQKNLDDLLNTLVIPGRPNDIKTLKNVLATGGGGVTLDDVGQMWLTQKILKATEQGTQPLKPQIMLDDLNQLTKLAENELFPGGMTGVRQQLRQMVDTGKAFSEAVKGNAADLTELSRLKRSIADPALWQDVQGDVLHRMFQERGDLITGDTMLNALTDLKHVKDVLFDPAQYRDLVHLAHTARAVQLATRERNTYWSPIVQMLGHGAYGGILLGANQLFNNPAYPAAIGIGIPAMSFLLSRPRFVKLLTTAIRTPATAPSAAYLMGGLLGHLGELGERATDPLVPAQQPAPR